MWCQARRRVRNVSWLFTFCSSCSWLFTFCSSAHILQRKVMWCQVKWCDAQMPSPTPSAKCHILHSAWCKMSHVRNLSVSITEHHSVSITEHHSVSSHSNFFSAKCDFVSSLLRLLREEIWNLSVSWQESCQQFEIWVWADKSLVSNLKFECELTRVLSRSLSVSWQESQEWDDSWEKKFECELTLKKKCGRTIGLTFENFYLRDARVDIDPAVAFSSTPVCVCVSRCVRGYV